MKPRRVLDTATSVPERKDSHVGQHKRPGILSPSWRPGLLRALAVFSHTWVKCAALGIGLVGQVVLLWLTWQAVDISISLAELWAELARKHLELTM